MADEKLTAQTELNATPDDADILYIVDDPGGTPVSKKITVSNLMGKAPVQTVNGADGTVVLDIEDLDNVTTATPSNGNVLNWQTNQWILDTRLTTLYQEFRAGTSSTVTDGANSNSEMELTGTTAKLKTGETGIEITETSPGDIEFVVATDSSGSTAFTAVHLDGTTTASEANFIIKQGAFLAIEGNSSATAKFRNTNSGNTQITVPASSGTMALTSDITAAPVDSVNGETGTVVLDTDDISEGSSNLYYTDARVSANSSVAANTAKNSYPSADATKLSGIEANADVTDAANVTAAGALMDSEVTNLAQVKAFDSSDYATAAQGSTADSALQDVIDDTSPELGGDLDVKAQKITTSTSNGNIELDPNGTGLVQVNGDTNPGAIKLMCENGSHGVTIKSPAHSAAATYTLTLPDDDGTSNQVLKTDGSGNLSWTDQSGSSGGSSFSAVIGGRFEFGTTETGATKWVLMGGYNGLGADNWTTAQAVTLSADPPTNGSSTFPIYHYLYGQHGIITPVAGDVKVRAAVGWVSSTGGMEGETMDLMIIKKASSTLNGTFQSGTSTVVAYGSVTCPSSPNIRPSHFSFDGSAVSADDVLMAVARFEDATFTSTQRCVCNITITVS